MASEEVVLAKHVHFFNKSTVSLSHCLLGEPAVRVRLGAIFQTLTWLGLLILFLIPIYITYTQRQTRGDRLGDCKWSQLEHTLYLSLHRLSWTLGLALLVMGGIWGWFNAIVKVLTISIWTPLSRLVYASYLIHPLVAYWMFYSGSSSHSFDTASATVYYLANVIITFFFALLLFCMIESPLGQIQALLSRKLR